MYVFNKKKVVLFSPHVVVSTRYADLTILVTDLPTPIHFMYKWGTAGEWGLRGGICK